MSTQRDAGTKAETAVVLWLRANGWPDVDRAPLRGLLDTGDLTGMPSHVLSVKHRSATSQLTWSAWLHDLQRMRRNVAARGGTLGGAAELPCGLIICKRTGTTNVGDWYAMTTVADYFDLFHELLT
jgi:hypothetical protein